MRSSSSAIAPRGGAELAGDDVREKVRAPMRTGSDLRPAHSMLTLKAILNLNPA